MPATPPIYDGPNAELVGEVLARAFGESILKATEAIGVPRELTVITDMREAVDAAGGVGPRGSIRIEYAEVQRWVNRDDLSSDDLTLNWHDL